MDTRDQLRAKDEAARQQAEAEKVRKEKVARREYQKNLAKSNAQIRRKASETAARVKAAEEERNREEELAQRVALFEEQKAAAEKAAAENTAAEKGAAEKGAAEKGAAEKGAAEKDAAEKAPIEKAAVTEGFFAKNDSTKIVTAGPLRLLRLREEKAAVVQARQFKREQAKILTHKLQSAIKGGKEPEDLPPTWKDNHVIALRKIWEVMGDSLSSFQFQYLDGVDAIRKNLDTMEEFEVDILWTVYNCFLAIWAREQGAEQILSIGWVPEVVLRFHDILAQAQISLFSDIKGMVRDIYLILREARGTMDILKAKEQGVELTALNTSHFSSSTSTQKSGFSFASSTNSQDFGSSVGSGCSMDTEMTIPETTPAFTTDRIPRTFHELYVPEEKPFTDFSERAEKEVWSYYSTVAQRVQYVNLQELEQQDLERDWDLEDKHIFDGVLLENLFTTNFFEDTSFHCRPCLNYEQGFCKDGTECLYPHPVKQPIQNLWKSELSSKVCLFWLESKCLYGNNCRNPHDESFRFVIDCSASDTDASDDSDDEVESTSTTNTSTESDARIAGVPGVFLNKVDTTVQRTSSKVPSASSSARESQKSKTLPRTPSSSFKVGKGNVTCRFDSMQPGGCSKFKQGQCSFKHTKTVTSAARRPGWENAAFAQVLTSSKAGTP
jgi:hypothetical protein